MSTKQMQAEEKSNVSTVQLAVGAASLFLFIVGLKRTFQVDPGKASGDESTGVDGYNGGGRQR